MNKKNFFITIEGGEGVGKSTAIKVITDYLASLNKTYVLTREPGGTKMGESIRHILLNPSDVLMHADTELLLMFAARAQNIHEVIFPALQAGHFVIADRFTDSSFAYQGGGRGIDHHRIAQLVDWVCGDLKPDLTLLLDTPVSVGYQRIKRKKDRIEKEGMEFLERVRHAYLQLAEKNPDRFRMIKADQPLDQVHRHVLEVVKIFIEEHST